MTEKFLNIHTVFSRNAQGGLKISIANLQCGKLNSVPLISVSGLVRQKNMQFVRVTRKQAKMCILTEFFAETFAFATKAERTLFFLFASFASHSVEKHEFYSHSGYIL